MKKLLFYVAIILRGTMQIKKGYLEKVLNKLLKLKDNEICVGKYFQLKN